MAHAIQVVIDARDPAKLGGFWREVLGYIEQPPPQGHDSWEAWAAAEGIPASERSKYYAIVDPDGKGPRLFFQRVPEDKAGKNRVHVDVHRSTTFEPVERRGQVNEAVRAIAGLGATKVKDFDVREGVWTVMLDPEGNEFCVV